MMRRTVSAFALSLAGCVAGVLVAGCSGGAPGAVAAADPQPVATTSAALTADDAIARAEQWVTAKLPYCQSPNHMPDPDTACASVCTRPDNPAWDPYRSDCSGLLSWAWGLPAPGRTTAEFAPAVTDITSVIPAASLRRGDAVNIPHDHTMLFKDWITPGVRATFIEEPGCSATPDYAHEFDSDVTISGTSITVAYNGMTFTAIRYDSLSPSSGDGGTVADTGGVPCVVSTTGESGECMPTAACAAMPGHESTPGYCPGAADIQCCTLIPGYDAGSASDAPTATDTGSGTTTHPAADGGTGTSTSPPADGAATAPGGGADDAGTATSATDDAGAGDDGGTPPHKIHLTTNSAGACQAGVASTGVSGWFAFGSVLTLLALRRRRSDRAASR